MLDHEDAVSCAYHSKRRQTPRIHWPFPAQATFSSRSLGLAVRKELNAMILAKRLFKPARDAKDEDNNLHRLCRPPSGSREQLSFVFATVSTVSTISLSSCILSMPCCFASMQCTQWDRWQGLLEYHHGRHQQQQCDQPRSPFSTLQLIH